MKPVIKKAGFFRPGLLGRGVAHCGREPFRFPWVDLEMSWEMRGEGWVNYWNTETSSGSKSHVCMPHAQYPLGFFWLPQIFGSGILWWKLIGIFTSSMDGMMGWSIIQNFEVGEIVSVTRFQCPHTEPWLMRINSGVYGWSVRIAQIFGPYDQYIWSNYSDLTRPHPKWCFSKGNPLISWKPRLVKNIKI